MHSLGYIVLNVITTADTISVIYFAIWYFPQTDSFQLKNMFQFNYDIWQERMFEPLYKLEGQTISILD